MLWDEAVVVPRVSDIYSSLPAVTGKLELEYEGELKGAEAVARSIIRSAVGQTFQKYFAGSDFQTVADWFEMGGYLRLPDTTAAAEALQKLEEIEGLVELTHRVGANVGSPAPVVVAAAEFVLEGMASLKRISRSEERGFHRNEERRPEIGFERVDAPKRHLN